MTEANIVEREIIRGRMPVAVVYLLRFGEQCVQSTKVKAEKFGTTVGKVDDVAKGRNFGYVTDTYKPTADQKAQARAWLERHPTGAAEILAELDALPEANEAEAAEFEAARTAARGQKAVDAEGNPVEAGGGNRRKRSKKAAEPEAEVEADSDLAETLLD